MRALPADRAHRDTVTSMATHEHLFAALDDRLPAAVELRHRLHADPRLSGDEHDTLALLLERMPSGARVSVASPTAAAVRIGGDGPSIALRGEMDALPIREATSAPFSATGDAMHACGHDVHMAALWAVLDLLAAQPDLPAPVVGLLQPREETSESGAEDFLAAGTLSAERVVAVIGAHVQPAIGSTEISVAPGLVNASADEFRVTIDGTPTHGGYPHLGHDPVLAAAATVLALQQLVARVVDPMEPAVVTTGTIHAGTAPNAVPGRAQLSGTLRAGTETVRTLLADRLEDVCTATAHAYGCTAEVHVARGPAALVNDPALAEATGAILSGAGFACRSDFRSMGADDFAAYGGVAPILMMFVGVDTPDGSGLHTPTFLPDDATVGRVAGSLLAGYLAGARLVTG